MFGIIYLPHSTHAVRNMAWELMISVAGELDSDREVPLGGSAEDIRKIIDSYFPGTYWQDAAHGSWADDDDGVMEFTLIQVPPIFIFLRVHDMDPSLALLAMAAERGWDVSNDSSDEFLSDECDATAAELRRLTARAKKLRNRPTQGDAKKQRRPKLGRIVYSSRMDESECKYDADKSLFLRISEHEDGLTIYYECGDKLGPEPGTDFKGAPVLGRNDELQTPDGRRFGWVMIKYETPAGWELFDNYLKESGRELAKVQAGELRVSDGSHFPLHDCQFISRAWKRRR